MKRLLIIFSVALLLGSAVAATPVFVQTAHAQAQAKTSECSSYTQAAEGVIPKIKVSIPIPGVTETVTCTEDGKTKSMNLATDLGSYLANFYKFFVGIVGILATVMVLYGGIRWILAAGNASRISGAKEVIMSAIIGVVIAFTSFLLLYLLNPRLVNYENLGRTIANVSVKDVGKLASLKCSELPDAKTVETEITKKGIECSFNTLFGDCQRAVGSKTVATGVACDDTATILASQSPTNNIGAIKGDICIGTSCPQNSHCAVELGRCISGFLWGTVDWVGNAYIDQLELRAVCKDGTLMDPRTGRGSLVTKPRGKIYSFGYTDPVNSSETDTTDYVRGLSGMMEDCNLSHGGYFGFTLLAEINDDQGGAFNFLPTTDDVFALDKNCKPVSNKDPEELTTDEWKGIGSSYTSPLFKADDLGEIAQSGASKGYIVSMKTSGFRCNINIDRFSFPSR